MYQHAHKRNSENVLILQGGGSLGAFACGVFKAFVKKNIKFDIISGTSIGAINGAIIAGSKNDNPAKDLEDFWLEIAESSHNIIPDFYSYEYNRNKFQLNWKRSSSASLNATIFGVPKFFIPRWFNFWNMSLYENSNDFNILPSQWTYVYDNTPLTKTLEKYIDFKKLSPVIKQNNMNVKNDKYEDKDRISTPRLIITSVDVLNAEPIIFDSYRMQIQMKHLLATIGYPQYGFPWIEVNDGIFAWDGSLLSNTPIREVLVASPSNDKNIFIVENYTRNIHRLPSNMAEVESRAKDILFCDKNMENIKMSRLITRQIQLIERLYEVFEKLVDYSKLDAKEIERIKKEYNILIENHGAVIKSVTRIVRTELESPSILQNADFSLKTTKELIAQGERKTFEELAYCENIKYQF